MLKIKKWESLAGAGILPCKKALTALRLAEEHRDGTKATTALRHLPCTAGGKYS